MTLPGNGWRVSGSMIVREKRPCRAASVGSVDTVVVWRRMRLRSTSPKKNVRLRRIGPPTAPPNWCRL